jgi:hypothetical protein
MQAARIVALHYHAMYNLACCLQPNTPSDVQLRCQARGESLGRQSDKMQAEYLHNQKTNPAGLPASAAVTPEPQPQPQPQTAPQAAADRTAAPPATEAAPKLAPAERQAAAAPPARPLKAPIPAPRNGSALPLDKAALEQLVADVDARLQTSALALAA